MFCPRNDTYMLWVVLLPTVSLTPYPHPSSLTPRQPLYLLPQWAAPWAAPSVWSRRMGSLPFSYPLESKEVREATSQVLALILTIRLPRHCSDSCCVCACNVSFLCFMLWPLIANKGEGGNASVVLELLLTWSDHSFPLLLYCSMFTFPLSFTLHTFSSSLFPCLFIQCYLNSFPSVLLFITLNLVQTTLWRRGHQRLSSCSSWRKGVQTLWCSCSMLIFSPWSSLSTVSCHEWFHSLIIYWVYVPEKSVLDQWYELCFMMEKCLLLMDEVFGWISESCSPLYVSALVDWQEVKLGFTSLFAHRLYLKCFS